MAKFAVDVLKDSWRICATLGTVVGSQLPRQQLDRHSSVVGRRVMRTPHLTHDNATEQLNQPVAPGRSPVDLSHQQNATDPPPSRRARSTSTGDIVDRHLLRGATVLGGQGISRAFADLSCSPPGESPNRSRRSRAASYGGAGFSPGKGYPPNQKRGLGEQAEKLRRRRM